MKNISRLVVVASLIVGVVNGAAPPSVAARAPFITLTPSVGPPTAVVAVEASGFLKGEVVALSFDEERVGSAIARGRPGNVETSFTVPETATPGEHDVTAVGAASGLLIETQFLVRTDWTQFHFDAGKTGVNPFENVLSPGNVSGIIIHDRRATEGPVSSSPAYCDGSVFVGDEAGTIYGIEDPDEFPWTFQTRGAILGSPAAIPPAIPPGPCIVAVGSMDGNLYTLDGGTGRLLWSVDVGAPISASPLAIGDPNSIGDPNLVVGDLAGVLQAFDAAGNRLWATQLDAPISAGAAFLQAPPVPDAPAGTLQLDPGSRIYVGTERGTLYSLHPGDGSISFAATLDGPIVSSPVVIRSFDPQPDPPKVYVGTAEGTLYSLYADDGTEIWSLATAGPITTTPAIGDPNLIGDPNAIGDPSIFVASEDGNVYAVEDPDERPVLLWTASLGAPIHTSPALANGVLYLGADDSKLHALDAATGQELFASEAITVTRSSPMVADGLVVVGTMHGEIVTFGLAV
jgi:outer membrane protein assembly factor BamB